MLSPIRKALMFKFYRIIFFLVFVLLYSCNTLEKKDTYCIGFSQYTTEDDWHKAVIQSMKIEAKLHKNIELTVLDGQGTVDLQIANVGELINKKVDLLIVSPIAPKPLKAIINKAIKANIPVIILDREIKDINFNSFIGVDNFKLGENAAKYITSLKTDANIIEIKGWAGTTPTTQRSAGFKTIIDKNPKLNIIGTTQERYDEPSIKKYFKELLLKNKKVNFVFAHKDFLALEAYQVAKELGLEDTIQFIGVGGVNTKNGGIDLVEQKVLKASILHPTGGKEAIQTAIKILNNTETTKNILLPSLAIDITNVGVIKRQAELILNQELDIERQQEKIKKQYQLYTSQKSFTRFTLVAIGIISLLLIATFLTKRKLRTQNKLLEEYLKKIASQKTNLEKTSQELALLNEATNNFFTGVSHDFKTPISLILSSTESLLTKNSDAKPKEYGLIYNNSKRLLRMITELLSFKQLESKQDRIQATKTNLNNFIQTIYNDFEKEAIKREIDFSFIEDSITTEAYIDKSLFDNILFNLLSNAFKFTTNKGSISINLSETPNRIFISIIDSGIGILAHEKDKVFDQFFQGSNNKQASSGIGLYLTKEYLKKHNGNIEIISSKEKGSEFKLCIPKGKKHFKPDEIIIDSNFSNEEKSIDLNAIIFEQNEENNHSNEEKETLLIIEDNTDLRHFLKDKLSAKYNIKESDGIGAIQKALNIIPDIIISDVNLPEKNGFEITKILKEDERTSHIPIIILTALNSNEAHLKGLKNGVDMFLTKPFNLSILHQSLKTLSYNRKRLQQFYQQKLSVKKIENEVISTKKEKKKNLENDFFNKINALIAKNIDDSSFTVEILAEHLSMSRVQLYRKTKAVLGISISDYIQNIRLEKAKELLLNETLSISDVAYSIGFSSPNYFSTSFKNKYGKTPNQFKKEEKNKTSKTLI